MRKITDDIMSGTIINATGSDMIQLWYLNGGRIYRKSYGNRSWLFVSGDPYDLDFLSRQLDDSTIYIYDRQTMSNVYGSIDGIRIEVYPSQMGKLVSMISGMGSGRKYSVFNADLDPVLRFMADRNLQFFSLKDPLDPDPELDTAEISGLSRMGVPYSLRVDGRQFSRIDSDAIYEAYRAIWDNPVIIYSNRDGFFSRIIKMILESGYRLPRIWHHGGSTYESYGQTHYSNPRISMDGRICIESDSFAYSETGLPGLMEISRTSGLPIETASVVTTGTAVSAMEESYAISRDILVPLYKDDHEGSKTMDTMISTDSGGLVLQPTPGIYWDIHEIDFSSMYPSIMVRYNLSPETLVSDGRIEIHGTPYRISDQRSGFLASALKHLLERRLFFKSVKAKSPIYSMRDAALKWMLLTSFGYTGYKNAKFGKIEIHEAITSMGRWALARAIQIARKHGFNAVHGIVDSLWLSGDGNIGMTLTDIARETGIGIVEDGYYRWIVFFPARSGLGALNRYMGLRYDGTMKVRGLHIRRQDSPPVVKSFQAEAIEALRKCRSPGEIWESREKILEIERRYIRNLRYLPMDDLRIPVHITRHREEYSVDNLQKMVLAEASSWNYAINPGSRAGAVIVDGSRGIVDLDGTHEYADLSYYRKLLSMAFEPIEYIVNLCAPRHNTADLFSFS